MGHIIRKDSFISISFHDSMILPFLKLLIELVISLNWFDSVLISPFLKEVHHIFSSRFYRSSDSICFHLVIKLLKVYNIICNLFKIFRKFYRWCSWLRFNNISLKIDIVFKGCDCLSSLWVLFKCPSLVRLLFYQMPSLFFISKLKKSLGRFSRNILYLLLKLFKRSRNFFKGIDRLLHLTPVLFYRDKHGIR